MTSRARILGIAGLSAAIVVAAQSCGDNDVTVTQPPSPGAPGAPGSVPQAPTVVNVNITQVFTPTPIIVQQDVTLIAKIIIVNDNSEPHWIVADDGSFDSGLIPPGATVTIHITVTGAHSFHCRVHPGREDETGTIQVNPAEAQPSPPPSPEPSPSESASPEPSPSESPSPTFSPAESPTPSPAPSPTESPTPSPTPSPTESPTPSPTPTEVPTPGPNTIVIQPGASARTNDAFATGPVTVDQGDTVTVINADTVPHTATADDGSFDTGEIAPGESASFVAGKAGDIPFFCDIHKNMRGLLRVEAEEEEPSPTPTPTETVTATPTPTDTPTILPSGEPEPGPEPEDEPSEDSESGFRILNPVPGQVKQVNSVKSQNTHLDQNLTSAARGVGIKLTSIKTIKEVTYEKDSFGPDCPDRDPGFRRGRILLRSESEGAPSEHVHRVRRAPG